jgi:hypothetical protein
MDRRTRQSVEDGHLMRWHIPIEEPPTERVGEVRPA